MMPTSTSAQDSGTPEEDWKPAPRSSAAIKIATISIANGFIFASHATVIAVKPMPPAVLSVSVPSAPAQIR